MTFNLTEEDVQSLYLFTEAEPLGGAKAFGKGFSVMRSQAFISGTTA